MAVTSIHAIKLTPSLALNYAMSDKDEDYDAAKTIPAAISYFRFKENGAERICYPTLNSFQNCNVDKPMRSFEERAERGRGKLRHEAPRTKDGKEIVMWHLMQSFSEQISPVLANEIGRRLAAEAFGNFTVVISTHSNTEHTHNHLMISAWDMDGRKWHDCHASKRKIRNVSDRLCMEYGLSILEKTSDMKLQKYTDKNGTIRYFEPTDRKLALRQQRKKKRNADYNLSAQQQTKRHVTLSNRERIKRDIDILLPYVDSYDDLLQQLRNLGYTVRTHKKDGSPLAHVTFQAPNQSKGTRDSSLGEQYCKEVLTDNISFYVYERMHPFRIRDSEVDGLIDTTPLKRIIEAQNERSGKKTDNHEDLLVKQIQTGLQQLYADKPSDLEHTAKAPKKPSRSHDER